jgi:beta-N-acetylhexosaminidase
MTDTDLGIRFIVEPAGWQLTESERALLRDLKPAGIMLRKRNFRHELPYDEWLSTYAQLLTECRQAIGRASIIVSVDHEGGGVHRFPPPITRFPYAATYGASPEAVFQVASGMGIELASLGINLSFSPVADIHSNVANPVINERAYGTTAKEVIAAAVACARALRQQGVVPCAKHFPGHGDTASDSHFAVPVLARTRRELESRELLPFKALIDDGIEMIMSAHLMVPEIDGSNQATVSPAIMTDLLRVQLGFSGLSIADALGMQGIHGAVRSGSFPALGHKAGLDLFLVVGDTVSIADACSLRNQFADALSQGELDVRSVLATEERIGRFLASLAQPQVSKLSTDILAKNSALANTLAANAPWSSFRFNPVGFE